MALTQLEPIRACEQSTPFPGGVHKHAHEDTRRLRVPQVCGELHKGELDVTFGEPSGATGAQERESVRVLPGEE